MTVDYAAPQKTYSNGKISLDKVELPDAHIIHGREFPVAYSLNLHGLDYDTDEVESFLAKLSKDGVFTQLIENHGTFVLRDSIPNSDDSKSQQVASIIKTIESNRGQVPFEQNGTLTLRDKKGFNLYTANKSPPEFRLHQHNEYSRFKKFPNSLIFTILEYTATGGETPLVHGGELYEKILKELPDFLTKLSKVGLKFEDEVWYKEAGEDKKVVWNHEVTFGRYIKPDDDYETQKRKALELAKEYVSEDSKFVGDQDDLVISSTTYPVKKFKSEPVLFSSIPAFADKYTIDEPKIKFGDGSLFDKDELDKFKKLTVESEYKHNWKSGDIVLVHNYQVSHGKLPYKDGKRSTLVAMWDAKEEERKKQFETFELSSVDAELEKLSLA